MLHMKSHCLITKRLSNSCLETVGELPWTRLGTRNDEKYLKLLNYDCDVVMKVDRDTHGNKCVVLKGQNSRYLQLVTT